MPLKCLQHGQEIFAFDIADEGDWQALRDTNQRLKHMTMPCCGSSVTLRTSKLGTRHFAHSRIGTCTTKPESAEHLLAKSIIAQSAAKQGWEAKAEQGGRCDNGDGWIADILVRKAGTRPVAFEVQWTRQTNDETIARQHRYHASAVRGLWLFRQSDFPFDRNVPAFRLIFDERGKTFSVALPSPLLHLGVNSRERGDARYWPQIIPLPEFVAGALGGRLKYAPAIGLTIPATIWTTEKFCYKCGCETKIVNFIRLNLNQAFPGHPHADVTIYDFDEWPEGRAILLRLLPKDLLASHNIGEVKPRFGGWSSRPQISNGCAHCGSLHGMMHDLDDIDTLAPGPEIRLNLDRDLLQGLEGVRDVVDRWWFEQG